MTVPCTVHGKSITFIYSAKLGGFCDSGKKGVYTTAVTVRRDIWEIIVIITIIIDS